MAKKIFISQPMRGKTLAGITKERTQIIKQIHEFYGDDVEIIDSFFENYAPDTGCVPLKYLAKSLELLADADIAYFAANWEDYRGCRIEHMAALEYGITVAVDFPY